MDEKKTTKKVAPKKDVKFNEEEATAFKASKQTEIVFGAGASEMVNFGGEDESNFEQKEREHNVIHLHYQQRTGRKCLTII